VTGRPPPRPAPPVLRPAAAWLPTPPCTPGCAADRGATVPAAVRRRRWLRVAGSLAGAGTAALRAPLAGARGRRRLVVCAAARLLTAAGVRVEVHASPTAWPRTGAGHGPGPLVVSNSVSWLDGLALLTVVPGAPVVSARTARRPLVGTLARRVDAVEVDGARLRSLPATVAEVTGLLRAGRPVLAQPEGTTGCGAQLGRFRPALFQAAVDSGAPVCPVAVRHRTAGGRATALPAHLAGEPLWRSVARVVAARGLVVEVHLLAALDPAGADRRSLAALAEQAVATVTERDDLRAGPQRGRHERVPAPRQAPAAGVPRAA
jgi:1-acyl-sn-glycerol-3-phosphate acyltransferase